MRCAANLRQIGQSCRAHAEQPSSGGRFPATFNDILGDIGPESLYCPGDAVRPNGRSYVYCGEGLTIESPGESVVAYEPLANHKGKGLHVLQLDGRVRWLDRKQAKAFLAARGVP
jgi:hypothetical protein